jgi:hypothetical protein
LPTLVSAEVLELEGADFDLRFLVTAGRIDLRSDSATSLSLPRLVTVTAIDVLAATVVGLAIDAPALTSLSLPSLTTVKAAFSITAPLDTFDVSALASVGGLHVRNTRLAALPDIPGAMTGRIIITGNSLLTSLPPLAAVVNLRYLDVESNPLLTTLTLPNLTTVANTFTIRDNDALKQCAAQSVRDRLTSAPATTTAMSGNNGVGACP